MKSAGFLVLLCLFAWSSFAGPFAPRDFQPMTIEMGGTGPGEPVPPPAGLQWYFFSNHTHTTYSGSEAGKTVYERIAEAGESGADAVAITDHQTSDACGDPDFGVVNGCHPMCGIEWGGSGGHTNLLNITPGDPMKGWPINEMIAGARDRGATVIVNHPRASLHAWEFEDLQIGVHGLEVYSFIWAIIGSPWAVDWWNELLGRGRMIVGVGGCDLHFGGNALMPCNHVLAASPEPNDIQEAIEAGRLVLTEDETKPRCVLWCDANGDGEFETPCGSVVSAPTSRTLHFRVEVYSDVALTVTVKTSRGTAFSTSVGPFAPVGYVDFTVLAGPETKDFVRVEGTTYATYELGMSSLTNPIYVNYTPDDADSDGLQDQTEVQLGTDHYDQDSDGDGVADGYEVAYDGVANTYSPYDPVANPSGGDLDVLRADTDGDGVRDGDELAYGTDPLDPVSAPQLPALSLSGLTVLMVGLAAARARA